MKDDEKNFFVTIYNYCGCHSIYCTRDGRSLTPRDIINIVGSWIHYKRCWYLLEKWSRIGFYDYGVTLDLGWINTNELPERYKVLVEVEE